MNIRTIACATACALQMAMPSDAPTQVPTWTASAAMAGDADAPQEKTFPDERLDQLVAPIALYPDALLAQVLMASTYPLEVVEASRYMQAHRDLKGKELEEALKDREWDASVKSLCGFPDLLQRMNDNLGWMRDLGDASIAQRADLMDAVQRMRRRAVDAGHLKSSSEMNVTETTDRIVTIDPPATEVVYVPSYYPLWVYGDWTCAWWWYPGFYGPLPPAGPYFWYGVGVPWGFGMWGGCNWGWHHSVIVVDVAAHDRFVQRTFVNPQPALLAPARATAIANANAAAAVVAWQHDPAHRRGVAYRSPAITQHFRATASPTLPGAADVRGWRPVPPRPIPGRAEPTPRPEPPHRETPRREWPMPRHPPHDGLRDRSSRGGGGGRG